LKALCSGKRFNHRMQFCYRCCQSNLQHMFPIIESLTLVHAVLLKEGRDLGNGLWCRMVANVLRKHDFESYLLECSTWFETVNRVKRCKFEMPILALQRNALNRDEFCMCVQELQQRRGWSESLAWICAQQGRSFGREI
jgi:hypothetical protein